MQTRLLQCNKCGKLVDCSSCHLLAIKNLATSFIARKQKMALCSASGRLDDTGSLKPPYRPNPDNESLGRGQLCAAGQLYNFVCTQIKCSNSEALTFQAHLEGIFSSDKFSKSLPMTTKICFGEQCWELEDRSWGYFSRFELRVEHNSLMPLEKLFPDNPFQFFSVSRVGCCILLTFISQAFYHLWSVLLQGCCFFHFQDCAALHR